MKKSSLILLTTLAMMFSSCACQKMCMKKCCPKSADDLKAEVMAADAAFADSSVKYGAAEAFNMFLADSAIQMPDGKNPVYGRDNIYAMFKASKSKYNLDWKPMDGQVSASGDLGWTWGNAVFTVFGDTGDTTLFYSKYLTVWEKNKDGVWKVKVDIGNERPGDK